MLVLVAAGLSGACVRAFPGGYLVGSPGGQCSLPGDRRTPEKCVCTFTVDYHLEADAGAGAGPTRCLVEVGIVGGGMMADYGVTLGCGETRAICGELVTCDCERNWKLGKPLAVRGPSVSRPGEGG